MKHRNAFRTAILYLVLCGLLVCGSAVASTEDLPDSLVALWLTSDNSCENVDVFNNVVAEVDELPVVFDQIVRLEAARPVDIAALPEMLRLRNAQIALWIECDLAEIHMFATAVSPSTQTRPVSINEQGIPQMEAISAIVRNWLEAVLPAWEKQKAKNRRFAEAHNRDETDSDRSIAPPKKTSNDAERSGNREQITFVRKMSKAFHYLSLEAGLDATSLGESRILPGGYAAITAQLHPRLAIHMSASMMKSARFANHGVTATLHKYPLRAGIDVLFPFKGVTASTDIAFELDPVGRDVTVYQSGNSESVKLQPALLGTAGIILPLSARIAWTLSIGVRVLLKETKLRIRINDNEYTVHDPWVVQPLLLTGLKFGLW